MREAGAKRSSNRHNQSGPRRGTPPPGWWRRRRAALAGASDEPQHESKRHGYQQSTRDHGAAPRPSAPDQITSDRGRISEERVDLVGLALRLLLLRGAAGRRARLVPLGGREAEERRELVLLGRVLHLRGGARRGAAGPGRGRVRRPAAGGAASHGVRGQSSAARASQARPRLARCHAF